MFIGQSTAELSLLSRKESAKITWPVLRRALKYLVGLLLEQLATSAEEPDLWAVFLRERGLACPVPPPKLEILLEHISLSLLMAFILADILYMLKDT